MRLFVNLNDGSVSDQVYNAGHKTDPFEGTKRGDGSLLEIAFHRAGILELLPATSQLFYTLKPTGEYDAAAALVDESVFSIPATVNDYYTAYPNYSTAFDVLLNKDGNVANDVAFIDVMGEVVWRPSPSFNENSSRTFTVRIANDVRRGGETVPVPSVPAALLLSKHSRIVPAGVTFNIGQDEVWITYNPTINGTVTLSGNGMVFDLADI
jgi:hypothetical protein